MELSKNKASVEHRSRSIANIVDSVSMIVSVVFRELKRRRRRRKRERQKSNRFRFAKQHLCTCIMLFCTLLSPWIIDTRLQKCEKAYVCFGKWKSRLQFFCEKRPATFWPDPFLSLKRCGLKNPQTERRLERHRGSWMCGCTLKIFLSERDAGVRGLNRRIKSKALFGQASTKTVTGQVISKVISPEVMSPEILS